MSADNEAGQSGGPAADILCFDFDGTMVDADGRIHPADVEVLAGERSVSLVPATGRPLHAVRRAFRRHGLFDDGEPIPFPMVLENGAAVYSEGEVLRAQRAFEPGLQGELLGAALAAPGGRFLLHSFDEIRTLGENGLLRSFIRRFDMDARPWDPDSEPAEAWERPLVKLVVTAEDPEVVERFQDATAGLPLERTYSLPNMLELGPAGVHKGRGLEDLIGEAGRAGERVAVVGDGENDLKLFEMADLSFAPQGCPPEIRARADRVLDARKEGVLAPILRELRAVGGRF